MTDATMQWEHKDLHEFLCSAIHSFKNS